MRISESIFSLFIKNQI